MDIDRHIFEIVTSIWDSMLRLPVEPAPGPASASGEKLSEKVSTCIHIAGAWQGTIVLHLDVEFGARVAGAFIGGEPAEALPADVRDALGELTNMIGGNVKALMPGDNYLSLPTVIDGFHHATSVPGSKLVTCLPLCSAGHRFSVSLLEIERRAA
jgi:chemotaxis protein CheX